MIELVQYETESGGSPLADWFEKLGNPAALKVRAALARIETGNFGDTKSVGSGVSERRIDFGPGYRIYFGRDGSEIVVLLAGGTKKRQQSDIAAAKSLWTDYKKRKKER
jgi:putative addiction module killer protein